MYTDLGRPGDTFAVYTGNIPHMNQPGTYKSYVILSLGFIPTREADATITKLGWTTYIGELNYVFTYYSTSRIDGGKILFSKPMFFSG